MTASLLFLGLNPLFVSPRDDTIARQKSVEKAKRTLQKKKRKYIQQKNKKNVTNNNNNLPAKPSTNQVNVNINTIPSKPTNIPPVNNRKYSSETSVSVSVSDEILSVATMEDNNTHTHSQDNIVHDIQNEMMYLILTKQRNEAMGKVQQLENELAESDVNFALKYVEFKKQLKQYKNTNNCLQIGNETLKNDVKNLKTKLTLFNGHNNLDSLLKKRRK
eukprot:UN06869